MAVGTGASALLGCTVGENFKMDGDVSTDALKLMVTMYVTHCETALVKQLHDNLEFLKDGTVRILPCCRVRNIRSLEIV